MIAELVVAAAMVWSHAPLTEPKHEITPSGLIVLHDNTGGIVDGFAAKFDLWNATGRYVVVKGICYSACAMPKAVFGFHQARSFDLKTNTAGELSAKGNATLWARYPQPIKNLLNLGGTGLTAEMSYFRGTLLMKPCPEAEVPPPPGPMSPQRVQDTAPPGGMMGPPPMPSGMTSPQRVQDTK